MTPSKLRKPMKALFAIFRVILGSGLWDGFFRLLRDYAFSNKAVCWIDRELQEEPGREDQVRSPRPPGLPFGFSSGSLSSGSSPL